MQTGSKKLTPILIKAALGVAIFGLAFPIYGIPMGTFKLTLFRAGNFWLLFAALLYGIRWRNTNSRKVLLLFSVFAIIRAHSLLVLAAEKSGGIQQIVWFMEGICFLLVINSLSGQFDDFYEVFLRTLFFIGGISVAIMVVQEVMLFFGEKWLIPLSTSRFGIEETHRAWSYPFYGGQILGAFYEPNMAGSMCAFFIAVFLPCALQYSNVLRVSRYLVMLAIVVTIGALIGTGSRQGVVAVSLVTILTAVKSRGTKKLLSASIVAGLFLTLFLFVKSRDTLGLDILPETVFDRTVKGMESDKPTGGRLEYSLQTLENIKLKHLLFGVGEGMGVHVAHNAYVIVLEEDGLVGLVCLLWLSVFFVYKTTRYLSKKYCYGDMPLNISSAGVVLVWIVLIFINWAQLNVSISYLYLAIPLMNFTYAQKNQNCLRLPAPSKAQS
ncbi:MAG TPA: hypothetical protein DCL44_11065 [Elusimicrobia bacterium]|nr:hypothetical protein [Elusimicrobiota bacterium]